MGGCTTGMGGCTTGMGGCTTGMGGCTTGMGGCTTGMGGCTTGMGWCTLRIGGARMIVSFYIKRSPIENSFGVPASHASPAPLQSKSPRSDCVQGMPPYHVVKYV